MITRKFDISTIAYDADLISQQSVVIGTRPIHRYKIETRRKFSKRAKEDAGSNIPLVGDQSSLHGIKKKNEKRDRLREKKADDEEREKKKSSI